MKWINYRAQDSPDKYDENIRVALFDLVPFVQFKNLEKHSWSSVIFSTNLLKVTLLHRYFHIFKIEKMVPNHVKRLIS